MTLSNSIKILVLLLLIVPTLSYAQKKHVSIRIGQDQSVLLDAYESSIMLKKKTFKIQVMLENVAGVYVFAAFTDSICYRLTEIDSIAGFMDLPGRTMAEPDYNKDKELLVSDDNSCSYWYYDKNVSGHRFNKKVIFLDTNITVGIKTVKQLLHVPTQREIKIKGINTPLYLFFVAVSEFDNAGRPLRELMRKKIKIEWANDD